MSVSGEWYHHGVSHSVGGEQGLLRCVRSSSLSCLMVDHVLLSKALILAKYPFLPGEMVAHLTCPWSGAGRGPCVMALCVYIP